MMKFTKVFDKYLAIFKDEEGERNTTNNNSNNDNKSNNTITNFNNISISLLNNNESSESTTYIAPQHAKGRICKRSSIEAKMAYWTISLLKSKDKDNSLKQKAINLMDPYTLYPYEMMTSSVINLPKKKVEIVNSTINSNLSSNTITPNLTISSGASCKALEEMKLMFEEMEQETMNENDKYWQVSDLQMEAINDFSNNEIDPDNCYVISSYNQ
ncbi:hypothetical protein K502DRAFT_325577 [Neoconidiobolus thromboides FSU 785]|nr:hypothetical protein K502DRAFT_325577 [Neoconidiobolus thromboides FSU 785]